MQTICLTKPYYLSFYIDFWIRRPASRGRSRFCLWLKTTKSKMRRPVYLFSGHLVGRGKYFELVKLPILVNLSDFVWSEIGWLKKSEMSDLGNKNILLFAHFVQISAPKSYCWAGMPNLPLFTSLAINLFKFSRVAIRIIYTLLFQYFTNFWYKIPQIIFMFRKSFSIFV